MWFGEGRGGISGGWCGVDVAVDKDVGVGMFDKVLLHPVETSEGVVGDGSVGAEKFEVLGDRVTL